MVELWSNAAYGGGWADRVRGKSPANKQIVSFHNSGCWRPVRVTLDQLVKVRILLRQLRELLQTAEK